ncbi:hypothetical protein [Sphingobacterium gobiense]|uniref:Uncharacterized protein n=1 Tax=Sphingobacterium gobiense TaxID=1382456 RepID=A0A2S9JUB4_9SPHI|nr:hypothetical protein [Sphingobacterium gobiense]PRD56854.1 hypothetical protein C5749_06450 [Sphingobacterium gobiense]
MKLAKSKPQQKIRGRKELNIWVALLNTGTCSTSVRGKQVPSAGLIELKNNKPELGFYQQTYQTK